MRATIFIEGLDLGRANEPPTITLYRLPLLARRRVGASMRKRRRRRLSLRLERVEFGEPPESQARP